MGRREWHGIVLAAVVALAAALRVYRLGEVPAGLFCDEAGLGFNAHCIANGLIDENGNTLPLFFWSFATSYKNPVWIYSAAVLVKILGLSEFSLRLTSALFGVGTVAALYYLGRALFGSAAGLCAALFLAVTPWHLHFSRIAFELISFPFLFVLGFTLLVGFQKGRRTLASAMVLMGSCIYAYAPANLFVPLFVAGAVLLDPRPFVRRWPETWRATVAGALTVTPALVFMLRHTGSSTQYFQRNAVVLSEATGMLSFLSRFASNYATFFSPSFLLRDGDQLLRHSVRGFGELLPMSLALAAVGVFAVLFRRDRVSKLTLWWLALYPVAASLMREVPSASRSIIGVPAFCLLAGYGLVSALDAAARWLPWRIARRGAQGAIVAACLVFGGARVGSYLHEYYVEYPKYSAMNNDGFQFGYRDTIRYMESRRSDFDRLLLTSIDVNHPEAFPLFYNAPDPRWWVGSNRTFNELGYWIIDPASVGHYSMRERNLYQLHPRELDYFSDYSVEREVIAPGGQVAWVIADVRGRKHFLTDWLALGLFDNTDGGGLQRDFVDVTHLTRDRQAGSFGDAHWRRVGVEAIRIDLNTFFVGADPRNPRNPESVCAYAATVLRSDRAQTGLLELSGSEDTVQAWVNGRLVTPTPVALGEAPTGVPIALEATANTLVLKSCENVGYWHFLARVTDTTGRDLPGIEPSAELSAELPAPAADPSATIQIVDGFAAVKRFPHADEGVQDHRGNATLWSIKPSDFQGTLAWETAPCPRRERTLLAFTGAMARDPAEADLYVNGEFALTFATGDVAGPRKWRRGGYGLLAAPRGDPGSGVALFLVDVPADRIVAGAPVELRVLPGSGHHAARFGIKNRSDTVAFEKLTPAEVTALFAAAASAP